MHCANCNGFVTPNVSTCTCDKLPEIDQRLDMHFALITRLYDSIDTQRAILATQRATLASMAGRLDLFQQIEDRQDTALTELERRLLDLGA